MTTSETWLPWSSPYEFATLWWRTFLNPTAYDHFHKADYTDHRREMACQFWAITNGFDVDVTAVKGKSCARTLDVASVKGGKDVPLP